MYCIDQELVSVKISAYLSICFLGFFVWVFVSGLFRRSSVLVHLDQV